MKFLPIVVQGIATVLLLYALLDQKSQIAYLEGRLSVCELEATDAR